MKNSKRIILIVLVCALSGILQFSCKKGDGDPFLSIHSRKARLCNDWRVEKIEQTVKYKTTTITTKFNGNKMTVEFFVADTTITLPDTTLTQYRYTQSYTGTIFYTFEKSGSYQIDESFTDDTTTVKYTSQEKGLWYFTCGSKDSQTKNKELLGLQPTNYVFNPLSTNSYTWTYRGENTMRIFHIYELAKKSLDLRYTTTETNNLFTVETISTIVLKPK
jgi:hypothetical protein